MKSRTSKINRETKETSIKAAVNLDGTGKTSIQTGISFLDHLITSFAKHSMIDLTVNAKSLDNIEHHLIEDVGITIGAAIDKALGNRSGITRFSFASVPMDESLAETSIDLVKMALGQFDLGPAAAMSLIYFFIVLLICWVFYNLMMRHEGHHE